MAVSWVSVVAVAVACTSVVAVAVACASVVAVAVACASVVAVAVACASVVAVAVLAGIIRIGTLESSGASVLPYSSWAISTFALLTDRSVARRARYTVTTLIVSPGPNCSRPNVTSRSSHFNRPLVVSARSAGGTACTNSSTDGLNSSLRGRLRMGDSPPFRISMVNVTGVPTTMSPTLATFLVTGALLPRTSLGTSSRMSSSLRKS